MGEFNRGMSGANQGMPGSPDLAMATMFAKDFANEAAYITLQATIMYATVAGLFFLGLALPKFVAAYQGNQVAKFLTNEGNTIGDLTSNTPDLFSGTPKARSM